MLERKSIWLGIHAYIHLLFFFPCIPFRTAPTELFAKILKQKSACNDLLEKKNELIATLEEEVRESDNQYKALMEDYHENIAVLSSRMEYQIQALENLVNSERNSVEDAYEKQRKEQLNKTADLWDEKLGGLNALSEKQMESRLQLLQDNENDLDMMILEDGEDFVDMKHGLEDSITTLTDQIQFTEAIHQLNEERLDYEIHVLRKREEEIVLVKSDQKRKITSLQDTINKLRMKVNESHKNVAKEESNLHTSIADTRKQLQKLDELRKSSSAQFESKKRQIIEMAREDVYEDLLLLVDQDYTIQRALKHPSEVRKVDLYLEPLFVYSNPEARRMSREESSSIQHSRSEDDDDNGSKKLVPASSALFRQSSSKSDSNMKDMLSALVHEANFLVEENLNILVDDIDENERNLFKLDSILAAIGMEGEDEVLSVLKRLESASNPSRTKGEILKTIRTHLEQNKSSSSGSSSSVEWNSPAKKLSTTVRHQSASGMSPMSPDEQEQEWNAMIASILTLMNGDRRQMFEDLKKFQRTYKNVKSLEDQNKRMEIQIDEMKNIYYSILGEGN